MIRRVVQSLPLVVVCLFTGTTQVFAAEFSSCAAALAEKDLKSKKAYQQTLRDLVVTEAPQFTELADISRDLQVVYAETRKRRLLDLLERDPGRLQGSNDLMAFRNFDWSDEEEAALRAADPDYDQAEKRADALRAKNDSHEDWPALREVFQKDVAKSPGFAALMGEFQGKQRKMEQEFLACRNAQE
jgi:hypothetical protein